MKKPIQWIAAALICAIVACSVGCDPKDKPTERVEDTRNLSAFEYTEANLTATDALLDAASDMFWASVGGGRRG